MEKNIVVKLRYDFKTMKHYNYYNLVRRRKGYLIYLVTGLISLAVAIYMLFTPNYVFAAVFGFLTLYFFYQILNFEKVIDNQITKFFLRNPNVTTKVITINEDTINISNPDSAVPQFSYNWEHINEIHDTPEYFFLMAYKSAPVIINKDPQFFIEGTLEELTSLIMEKAQAKPFTKVEKPIVKRPIVFVHKQEEENVIEGEIVEDYPEGNIIEQAENEEIKEEETNEEN